MNSTQSVLIKLLVCSLTNSNIENINYDQIDWNDLLNEAKNHDVHTLLYPLIKNISLSKDIDQEVLSTWKKETIIYSVMQQQNIDQMQLVFGQFELNNIPVIALKGLALRSFYPHPNLRNMCDTDILVDKENIELAEAILQTIGYYRSGEVKIHSSFQHPSLLSIDLHWSLVNEAYIKNASDIDKLLWDNLQYEQLGQCKILTLNLEYQLLHILIHLASHLIKSGFGLRQLVDLYVLLNAKKESIDYDKLSKLIVHHNIEKFSTIIFSVCHKLFNLDIPQLNDYILDDDPNLDLFIEEILNDGVFTNSDESLNTRNRLLSFNYKSNSEHKFKYLLAFLFPSSSNLEPKYNYAKKHKYLLVFSWIHRILYVISRNGLKILPKIIFFYKSSSSARRRVEILRWLEL
jgi:hypothetical protein